MAKTNKIVNSKQSQDFACFDKVIQVTKKINNLKG